MPRLNETIMIGKCRKCAGTIYFQGQLKEEYPEFQHFDSADSGTNFDRHTIEPVWFLSPNQMITVKSSKEFYDYFMIWSDNGERNDQITALADLVKMNPFLVASILKGAEK